MDEAYIYDAVRTPRGKGKKDGTLHEVPAVRLSAVALNELKNRNNLEGHAVEDVIWGNVTQVGEQGACLARSAVLYSDLDERVPGVSINRFCASGLEAVNMAANQVRGGGGNAYIAGGVESMSRVPMGSDGGAIAADPTLAMKSYFVPQGISSDIIATEYGFSRDDCDAYAVESQKRAAAAQKAGNAERGREIYQRQTMLCSTCHLIDNRGGKLGPDLTTVGSYMTPESLLESLINPSSSIKQGYETVLVTTRDNSLVAGLLQRKTGDSVLLRDTTGKVTAIPNRNVAKIDVSPVSLMPPGLTASLRRDEMVDLLKFLTSLGKKCP